MSALVLIQAQKNRIWSMLYLGVIGLLFLAGFSGNAKPTWAQTSPTVINIGTTAIQTDVKRLGINISGEDFYDSGQMLRDLTFNNPGFEGQQWRTVLVCSAVSGTKCTDGNSSSQWPANFIQGGTFTFLSGANNGKTGTIVSQTQASGTGSGASAWYDFGTVTPAVGDTFTLQKNFSGIQGVSYNQQAGWWVFPSNGATITSETTDLSPETQGVQALSINAGGSGQYAQVVSFFDGATRAFIQFNGTYTVTFRAKGNGGANKLNVSVGRNDTTLYGNVTYLNQTVQLTNEWADYSYSFTANENGTYIGGAFLNFSVSGANVLLDDAALTETADADNPTAFRNAVFNRLKGLNPGVLRYMDSGPNFGSTIDNMIAPPDARLRTGYNEQSSDAFGVPLGLEEFLQLCQAVGAEPWYTVQNGVTATEAHNLIEFLAGDSSTQYGAKRAALGQTAPWTTVFPKIHLELGNESWNSTYFGEAITNPIVYGAHAATIFGAMRAAPDYNAANFDLILDGFASGTWYGQTAMNNAANTYDTVDAAPYYFYSFDSYANNEAVFGSMYGDVEGIDSRTTGAMYQNMLMATGKMSGLTGKPANLAVYEVSQSTFSGSAPENIIAGAIPSIGGSLSFIEHMLLMMRDDGVSLQSAFTLPGYGGTNSNGNFVQLWGMTIDMGGETNLCRPSLLAEQLANTAIGGTMVQAVQSGANPTWDVTSPNDPAFPINITGAHYIQSFAFVNGTQNSLILLNLSRTSSLPVTFTGVNAPTGTVQVGLLTSANITDNNEVTGKVAIANSTIENFNPAATTNLPPYSMTVYQWTAGSGVTPPGPAPTTTTLSAAPASIDVGQTVVLTAKVATTSNPTPASGSVTFSDGGTTIATASLSSGQASFSDSALPVGSHTITATFTGNSAFGSSTSSSVVVTVAADPLITTTTALTAPATTTVGQTATLNTSVTAASGSAPTGTVTFSAGSTVLGTATLSSGKGSYTLSPVSLAPGTYQLKASYGGSSTDGSSSSSTVSMTVAAAPLITTSTTLTAPATATDGQTATLNTSVTAASGSTPTGTVTFSAGSTVLGTATLSSGKGSYTLSPVSLAPGTYQLTASYSGSSTDSSSSSSTVSITIAAAPLISTDSTLTAPASATDGQTATLKAAVTAASGSTPTGTVTFKAGATTLGTATLSNGTGIYTLSPVSLAPGTYQLTAVYAGSSTDSGSISSAVSMTVAGAQPITTTSTLTAPSNSADGQSVAISATVKAASGSTPTGTVTFMAGSTVLGTASLSGGTAPFTIPSTALTPGSYQLTAIYAGDSADAASTSAAVALTVAQATTNVALTVPASVAVGQTASLNATVTPSAGPAATGSVRFLSGQTVLATVDLSNGKASYTLSPVALAPGVYSLTASYSGNGNDLYSVSNAATMTVTADPTTTVVSLPTTKITEGQSITVNAKVQASVGSTPTGTVNFYIGSTEIGSSQLSSGAASLTIAADMVPGTYQGVATYEGSSTAAASTSSAVTFTIVAPSAVATTTSLSSSATQVAEGSPIVLTASVSPQTQGVTATGAVTFYLGQTALGTGQLAGGQAVFNLNTQFAPGTYQLMAAYAGNASDQGSTSNPVTLIIMPVVPTIVATTTTLSSSTSQITQGQPFALTAVVAPATGSAAAQGTVSFYLGQTQIGTAVLINGTATLSETSSINPGTYPVTAVYSGSTADSASTSNTLTLVVSAIPIQQPVATTTGLSVNPQQPVTGQPMALQVQVTAAGTTTPIAGTVTIYMGQTAVGTTMVTAGTASVSMLAPQPGTYTATASFTSQADFAASQSTPITFTVQAPATAPTAPPVVPGTFTLGLSNTSVSLGKADTASLQVMVASVQGYTGSVQLNCAGLPATVTCSFAPADLNLTGSQATSTLVFSSQQNTSAYTSPIITNVARGLLLPWDILGVLGVIFGRKRLRGRWTTLATVCLLLVFSMGWMTGCGLTVNSATVPYQVTVTAVGQNQITQSTTLTLYVTQPAAQF